jgi:23S rRNA (adenine2503-C2)-methyltransferase
MIDKLSEACDVSLAVSRCTRPTTSCAPKLVPLNKKYPIAELMAACQRYARAQAAQSITFEYTLMKGVNDQPEHARALVKLLRRLPSKLNLIPFNPFPGTRFERSDEETIRHFQTIVMEAGLIATVRRTRGDDIDAARASSMSPATVSSVHWNWTPAPPTRIPWLRCCTIRSPTTRRPRSTIAAPRN